MFCAREALKLCYLVKRRFLNSIFEFVKSEYIIYAMFPHKSKTTLFLRFWVFLPLLLFTVLTSRAESNRIVGYLPYYRFNLIDQMELHRLTHLVIAFGHPDAQGNVEVSGADIWPVVRKAHGAGIEVLLSLGGGALAEEDESYWKTYLQPWRRGVFIRNLVQYIQTYDLDGIDVDLEWKHIDANYSGFVLELARAIRPYNKLLTAALPATHRYSHLTDEALDAFDFINIMGYDLTGPFNPERPGQHAPFSFAVNAINFWKEEGVPAHRMTLGLPMFGWNFSTRDTVFSVPYRDLVEMDASFALLDQVGKTYYNGLSMIKAKTELAQAEVSGVMLWELGQDAFNEWSLLRAVHQIMYPEPAAQHSFPTLEKDLSVLERSTILGGDHITRDRYELKREGGRLTLFRVRNDRDLMSIPLPKYPPAFYFSALRVYEALLIR